MKTDKQDGQAENHLSLKITVFFINQILNKIGCLLKAV